MLTSAREISGSVENSYRPVARVYLFLGLGDLLQQAGSPGGRPQKSISQLLQVLQDSMTPQFAVKMVE